MRVVFLGTPEFAVPTLERLVAAGHQVAEVVTQPDRPKGRNRDIAPSPVKASALRHGIPVFQPERIRRPEAVERLRALVPDAMVVVGYGQIIPQNILDIPPLGITQNPKTPKPQNPTSIINSLQEGLNQVLACNLQPLS